MKSPQAEPQTGPSHVDVALADGNRLMLAALSELFDRDPRMSLVFTTNSAESFLEGVQRVPVAVGVLDWQLPSMGAERLMEQLRRSATPPRVVVYGGGDNPDVPRRAMAAGAAGFCSRDDPPERLLETVSAVAQGNMVFPFLDVRSLNSDPIERLTARERALLTALSRGLSNKELAAQLDISVNTIKFHLRNLFDKLSVKNRAQAIALFFARGLASRRD